MPSILGPSIPGCASAKLCTAALIAAALHGCTAKEQAPPPPPPEVVVSQVLSREVTDWGLFTGRTDAVESVDVRARVSGYLQEIHFADGAEVKKGDLLFQIDPRPFQAMLDNDKAMKAMWEARLARAEADVARYEELVPSGAATAQDLDKARAARGEAVAAIQSAQAKIEEAQLNLEFASIRSPIDGQVSDRFITRGNLVRDKTDQLTTIVSLDPMYVYFDMDEHAVLHFRKQARESLPPGAPLPKARTLKIPVFVGLINEEGYPHEGVIDFADNRVDATTGTVRVRGVFDNAERVFNPGFFVRVRIPMGKPATAALISDRAVGTDQGQKFVYVIGDDKVAQYRAVKLGALENDGLRVVKTGLKPDEWVVVTGIQRVRPGKPVTPKREEMPRAGTGEHSPAVVTNQAEKAPAQAGRQ